MSRLGLALMLMAALVATSFAWPVATKKSAEEGLTPQKVDQQDPLSATWTKVVREAPEFKDHAQEPKEQLQVKSASSEVIEKAEISGLMKEETLKQEHKEDVKAIQEEPKETTGLSEKVMQPLQKAAVDVQPAEASAPAAAEPAKEIAQPATVQETILEKKAEAKSSDVAVEPELENSEVKEEAQVKTLVDDAKPAEPEQTPEVIEPVAETKQFVAPATGTAPAQSPEKVKSEPIQEPAKIDDKNDRVTREAEEAAKKLAQQKEQQQAEEKKEVVSPKVPKSQESAQQPAEKQPVAEEKKIPEGTHQQPALPVEASIAEQSEPKSAATEQQTGVKVESEGQQQASSADGSSQPFLKLNGIHEDQEEPAAVESAVPVEKVTQEGTQQIVDEVKAEVKEAKSAEQEPIKAEELPKPEEVKKEMKPETLSDEVKKPEKLPKHSSEEDSDEEKSSEEKLDKTGNSSEEMNEKEVSSSRSAEVSSEKQQPSSS